MTASFTSKTNNFSPLHISGHRSPLEAQCDVLARAIDLHRPLQSMVALVVKIGQDRFSATLLARRDAEAMTLIDKFARALAAPPGDQLLLLMMDGRRSIAGLVSRDGCLEAALAPETTLFCPLCAT